MQEYFSPNILYSSYTKYLIISFHLIALYLICVKIYLFEEISQTR